MSAFSCKGVPALHQTGTILSGPPPLPPLWGTGGCFPLGDIVPLPGAALLGWWQQEERSRCAQVPSEHFAARSPPALPIAMPRDAFPCPQLPSISPVTPDSTEECSSALPRGWQRSCPGKGELCSPTALRGLLQINHSLCFPLQGLTSTGMPDLPAVNLSRLPPPGMQYYPRQGVIPPLQALFDHIEWQESCSCSCSPP